MKNPYKEISKVNPQKENGHREICNPVFQTLMAICLSGAEYQVAMTVIDKTWGFGKQSTHISLTHYEQATNLSRQSVISAIKSLENKHIIVVDRDSPGKTNEYLFNKHHDTWLGSQANHTTQLVKETALPLVKQITLNQSSKSHQTSQVAVPSVVPTKETIKETIKEKDQDQGPDSINKDRKKVFEGLEEKRGYNSPVAGAEAKAITWMLKQGYSAEQILSAHDKLKTDKFWADKFLNMQSVKAQIGELVKAKPKDALPTTEELKEGWGKKKS